MLNISWQRFANFYLQVLNAQSDKVFADYILSSSSKALIFFLSLVSISQPLQAENGSLEYKIKAGYLYNFSKFIDWPIPHNGDPDQSFNICLLGNDPFGYVLTPIKNKTTKGLPIRLVYFSEMTQEVKQCKILFISHSERQNIKRILQDLSGLSVLAVADMENFAENGGMIGFVRREDKVRLQINNAASVRVGLKISAKLLEIADAVLEVKQ